MTHAWTVAPRSAPRRNPVCREPADGYGAVLPLEPAHPSTASPPLLDRDPELRALRQAAAEVASGASRVILVEGGPGVGKTRLLAEARTLAGEHGLRVLSACGGAMEREHPYGIVRQLFEAALLGPEPAGWLDGPVPAGAAASVFRPEASVDPDAVATLGGLHWLTRNAAAEGPLAIVVDDLHWADQSSLHFLQYLVRRIEGAPVLIVLGGRPAKTASLLDITLDPAVLVLQPTPLSAGAVHRLLAELLRSTPDERFADACSRASGGNPLLLVELLRTLQSEGIAPDDAHVEAVEDVGPSSLARVALVRLRRLGGVAVSVAQAIALLGQGASTSLVAELAEVEERAVAPAVAQLVEAAILDATPPLDFVHPVVRDAVYRELTPDERDRRHARAAEMLHTRGADPDAVGAHLVLCAPRGERWAVDVLRAAADDAAQRGAVETAVTFGRRALAERPADADARALVRLALAEATFEPDAAIVRLEAARRAAPDAAARAQVGDLLTRLLVFTRPREAVRAAREARTELSADTDGDRVAGLLALERYAGRFLGEPVAAQVVADPARAGGRMLLAVQAWDRSLDGEPADDCVAQATAALLLDGPASSSRVFTRNGLLTAMIATTVLLLADDERAVGFWEAWTAEAVRSGRAHAVVADTVVRGYVHLRRGQLPHAEALLRTGLDGPRRWDLGTGPPPAGAIGVLADVLIERGEFEAARATLDRAPRSAQIETEHELQRQARELRILGAQGRHQDVLDGIAAVRDQLEAVPNPVWYPWRSTHAQALAGVGRPGEAAAVAEEELELARRWGTPGPIGSALTVLGTLEARRERLEEAVEVTRSPWARLEHARALLALGGNLRRAKRPTEARAHLREAHDLAVRCGATPMADAARWELAAAGGRPRSTAGTGADSLTPSERRVAELAAAGRRNQEIAQQLFLSPKTIEVHLSSSYRKLGISARGELAAALGSA